MTFRACLLAGLTALGAGGADKAVPNQAGNAKISLQATAVTDRKVIAQLLGVDLGDGWVVVHMHISPKTPEGLHVSIDDFTLVSRKDGEKSRALAPSQIAGAAALVVGPAQRSGGGIAAAPAPNIGVGGVGVPPSGGGIGAGASIDGPFAEARLVNSGHSSDPRLAPLEAKVLRDQETKEPVEGLLYFALERRVKPKDLGLIYSGPGGRLAIDFK